jgi:predicted dehydrogenase
VTAAEPERVAGEQVLGDGGVDIAFSGTMRFPGDVLAQFDCGFAVPHRYDLEAIGEDGSLFLPDPWHGRDAGITLTRDGAVEAIEVPQANPYSHELADFARAARGEAPPRYGLEDALAQARAIEALYASAESGRSVALEAPVA